MTILSLFGDSGYSISTEDDEILVHDSKFSINNLDFFLIQINSLVGIGPFKLSQRFECGIILTTLINLAVCLLIFFANWMLVKIGSLQKTFSYASSWKLTFKKFAFVPPLMAILPSIPFVAWFFINIELLITPLMKTAWESIPVFVTDVYFMSAILSTLFALPGIFNQSLSYVRYYSYVAFVMIVIVMIGQVINFSQVLKITGFDPYKQLSLWNMEGDYLGAISEFIGCYTAFVYTFQVVRNTKKVTLKKARTSLMWAFVFCFCYYEIFGLIGYMTVWNRQDGELILDLIPPNPVSTVMRIAMAINVGCTIPVFLNAVRDNALEMIREMKSYPPIIFYCTGIIVLLVAIVFSALSSFFLNLMTSLLNFCVMLVGFVIPGAILLKSRDKLLWYQRTMCVVCIIIGSCFALYTFVGMIF